jgi:hypothetical protein
MDYVVCCIKNFNCSDYNGPIEIKNVEKSLFYLLYKDDDLLEIAHSYNYSINYGIEVINSLFENYISFGLIKTSIEDVNIRRKIVNNHFTKMQIYSNALWFIKDNAVTPYFASISSDSAIRPEMLKRNVYFSNSEAKYDIVAFTTDELKEAIKWYDVLEKLVNKIESEKVDNSSGLSNMSSYVSFDIPSFQRAYYFLGVSRRTDFLPSKIANYISLLECLFAVKGENTHKTAERAAALIGKNTEDRMKIFKDVVKIYNLRSSYIHGSEMNKSTHESLPNASKIIDNVVRRILSEMLTKHPELNYRNSNKKYPELKNFDEVNDWFNHLVLSKE